MQTTTTTAAILTTSFLAALASAQSTVVYTGEPEQIAPDYSLSPSQSAIVQKYTSDIAAALDALVTNSLASDLDDYLHTASILPSDIPSAALAALGGQPIPTGASNNPFSELPSSLQGPVISEYNSIASLASVDLSADPALMTEAPYYVAPAQGTTRPKITEVESKKPYRSGAATGGYAKQTGTAGFATKASGSGGVAVPYGTGSGAASGHASSTGSPSQSTLSTSTSTGAASPITSAKPTGGASSLLESRASLSVGALVVVGCVFVGLL